MAQLVWIQEDLAKFCYQPDMKFFQYLRFLLCFGFLVEPTTFFSIFRVPNFDENFQNSRKFSQIYTKKFVQSPSGKTLPKKQADWNFL